MALVDVADLIATTSPPAVDVADITASTASTPPPPGTGVVDAADVASFTVSDVATYDGTTWISTHSGTFSTTIAPTLVESGASTGVTRSIAFTATPTLTLAGSLVTPVTGGGITVTALPASTPPLIAVNVAGMSGQTVTITRQNLLTGEVDVVRNADTVPLSAGAVSVTDSEVPYQTPVAYTATTNTGVFNTSAATSVVVPDAWLVHPSLPDVSLPLVVQSRGDRSRPASVGVFQVMGRSRPLIRSDGVRRAPTFDLVVYTADGIAAQSLLDLIGDGSALLLQIPADGGFYDWVSVGDVTESDLDVRWADDRLFTLPCTVVDRPVVSTQSLRTLADVAAEFGSLLEVKNNYATLADIASDNLIGA